jgi:predicted nucleic acid-binding protein
VASEEAPQDLLARMEESETLHAPHLIDVEFLHALRGLVAGRVVSMAEADAARISFAELPVARYPHHPMSDRIWELRHNVTAYDATYVALAEALDLPLVTCDGRLARSKGHGARIELFR